MISVNMKNIAGASGGGEDKRLKKNCEYILIYARNYQQLERFQGAYDYTEMSELIQQYIDNHVSWKYTSILVYAGDKEYIGSTIDGDGNEIKIFRRNNPIIKSVKKMAGEKNKSEKEIYHDYGEKIFQTTNAQTSIRTRVIDARNKFSIEDDLISIEYIPKTGKNKGQIYEQFYKGSKARLFAWLKDTSEVIDGVLYKKDLQGTYWNFNPYMKNLNKEGRVEFSNSKKPENLVKRILEMCTNENDLILDSFLGSGTTAAVAHKMNRRYIGIELGEHAYTHCKVRLDRVIDGDESGISKEIDWQGGGGYKFYELAPTLLKKDTFGEYVINSEYDAEKLAAAVALHEGFAYEPSAELFWKQAIGSENSYLFTTTKHVNGTYLDAIASTMNDDEYLLITCKSFDKGIEKSYKNITIKKIPQVLLDKCEFDVENYNLNIVNPPVYEDDGEEDSDE